MQAKKKKTHVNKWTEVYIHLSSRTGKIKSPYLLHKVAKLPFELFEYMLHNQSMMRLTFSHKSDLVLNETTNVR